MKYNKMVDFAYKCKYFYLFKSNSMNDPIKREPKWQ